MTQTTYAIYRPIRNTLVNTLAEYWRNTLDGFHVFSEHYGEELDKLTQELVAQNRTHPMDPDDYVLRVNMLINNKSFETGKSIMQVESIEDVKKRIEVMEAKIAAEWN